MPDNKDDQCAISIHSFSSVFVITPKTSILSGQSTDEFELIGDSDEDAAIAPRDDAGVRNSSTNVSGNDGPGDDSFDAESSSMSSASVSPSIYAHEFEYFRRYHSYKSGRYPFPNDLPEQRREETLHLMMLEITDGHVFFSEVGEWPQKIIDIGTGIVADLYQGASVQGTDLSPIQPSWLPVNLRMFVEDCEGDWLHGGGFDLVHLREVAGTLRDLDGVVEKIHANLAPGGWVEFQDIEPDIFCDDASMKPSDPLRTFFHLATTALQAYGCTSYPPSPSATLHPALSRAGFTNIQTITKKIPISAWARDRRLLAAGVLAKEWVAETIDALAAKPLAAGLELGPAERKGLAAQARRSLEREGVRRYLKMNFVIAQKANLEPQPELVSDSESYMSLGSA